MTQTFDVKVPLTPVSVSMLQILAFVVIGLMVLSFCFPPVTTAGKVGDIALIVGGVALAVGSGAAALGAAPAVITVAGIVAIGAGTTAIIDGARDLLTSDDTSS